MSNGSTCSAALSTNTATPPDQYRPQPRLPARARTQNNMFERHDRPDAYAYAGKQPTASCLQRGRRMLRGQPEQDVTFRKGHCLTRRAPDPPSCTLHGSPPSSSATTRPPGRSDGSSPRPTSRTCWPGSSDTNRKSTTSSNPPAAITSLPHSPQPHNPRRTSAAEHLDPAGRPLRSARSPRRRGCR